jgi:predicted phage terminase large subunit-like protein
LEVHRRAMSEYNFVAQYQQNPQPPSGIIVKREWLKFYDPSEVPETFDVVVQSWDTANKDSELANFSVCTTWGLKDDLIYLLNVFRRKLNFPQLKRFVLELAALYSTDVVLVEDKASGTSLIQELHADGFSNVQAAPSLDGDKIMRLHGQTAKIEGGFVLFPKEAAWLGAYVHELVGFPNAKHDDQVDSTVFALAWSTPKGGARGWLKYMKMQVDQMPGSRTGKNEMFPVWLPPPASTHHLFGGRQVNVPENRIVEMTEEEFRPLINGGARRVD